MTFRKFPCHTASATWLSAAFFHEKQASAVDPAADITWQRLMDAADFFNITEDVNALTDNIKQAHTSDEADLPDSSFALVITYDNGDKERRYPLRNAIEVKAAAEYLNKYRRDFNAADRQRIAKRIVEKQAAFGADLGDASEIVQKLAGNGSCSAAAAAELVRGRISAMRNRPDSAATVEMLSKVAAAIESNPGRFYYFGPRAELAQTLDDCDNAFQLKHMNLPLPEEVLFDVTADTVKQADAELTSTLTGRIYKKADLENLPLAAIEDGMGEAFARAISVGSWVDAEKLAAILPTLPRNDAEMFDALVSQLGVAPFATQKSAFVQKPVNWAALAAQAKQAAPGSLWANN